MKRFIHWLFKGPPGTPPEEPAWLESFFNPTVRIPERRPSPGPRPGASYGPSAGPSRGAPVREQPTGARGEPRIPWGDPGRFFELETLWQGIRQGRTPEFIRQAKACKTEGEEAIIPLVELVPAGQKRDLTLIKHFGLPLEEIRASFPPYHPWDDWIEPFLSDLEKKLNGLMPEDIEKWDGVLEFGYLEGEEGREPFGLIYYECAGTDK